MLTLCLSLQNLLQNLGGLVRYMTHAHRRDFLESALHLISRDKLFGMIKALSKRYADIQKLTGRQ